MTWSWVTLLYRRTIVCFSHVCWALVISITCPCPVGALTPDPLRSDSLKWHSSLSHSGDTSPPPPSFSILFLFSASSPGQWNAGWLLGMFRASGYPVPAPAGPSAQQGILLPVVTSCSSIRSRPQGHLPWEPSLRPLPIGRCSLLLFSGSPQNHHIPYHYFSAHLCKHMLGWQQGKCTWGAPGECGTVCGEERPQTQSSGRAESRLPALPLTLKGRFPDCGNNQSKGAKSRGRGPPGAGKPFFLGAGEGAEREWSQLTNYPKDQTQDFWPWHKWLETSGVFKAQKLYNELLECNTHEGRDSSLFCL